jgi:putative endopeptidase
MHNIPYANIYTLLDYCFLNNIDFPVYFDVQDDPKQSTHLCLIFSETNITYTDLDLYKKQSYLQELKSYVKKLTNMFDFTTIADDVVKVEKMLSNVMYKYQNIPIEKTYNKYSSEEMMKTFGFDLPMFTETIGFKSRINYAIVENPKHFKLVLQLLNKDFFNNYVKFNIILSCSAFHKSLDSHVFNFHGKFIEGIHQDYSVHEKACHNLFEIVNIQISEIYLKQHENKAEIEMCRQIAHQLKSQLIKRLDRNTFLNKETIQKAKEKIKRIRFIIGYSKSFLPRFEYDVKMTNPFHILDAYQLFKKRQMIDMYNFSRKDLLTVWNPDKAGNVYDVNAYYLETENAIVLPNGFLQPPFVDTAKSYEYNLAILGSTIGHEMFHAIDDEGCKYDEFGNYRMWWHQSDVDIYKRHLQHIINEYDRCSSNTLDTKLTLGENISDVGGFLLAEELLLQTKTVDDNILKTFYKSYAIQWRIKISKKVERLKLKTDTHALFRFRTDCVLNYSKHFWRLFKQGRDPFVEKKFFW